MALRILYWATPCLFCLWLYWHGLKAWFQQDDFAWLGLHLMVYDFKSLLSALFVPLAQGTIRPWSERVFFMVFVNIFGLDALPFRIAVFATMFAAIAMLMKTMNRLTGAAIAGFAAAILWIANSALGTPLSWTSAYNQILCSLFLLTAFYLFLRFTETGDKKFYIWQWIVFLLGFGALEINVVYPAIAALYALCCARRWFRHTLPMFAASAAYTLVHRAVAPKQTSSIYQMFFDSSIFTTLGKYLRWTVGAERVAEAEAQALWPYLAAEAITGAAVLVVLIWAVRRRQWLPLFFAGWFFIVLAPVLPLKNHISEYYLTIPSIGFAMLGGYAFAEAWKRPWQWRAAALAVALLYAYPSAWAARKQARYNYEGARRVKAFVSRVAYAHQRHPRKILLIRNMDSELFWNAFYSDPFRIFGLREIYLTADNEKLVEPFPEIGSISRYFLPDTAALNALKRDQAVVYEVAGERLRNITPVYSRLLASRADLQLAPRVELGQAAFETQLVEGWYGIEAGYRWMSRRGVLKLRGPETAREKLAISGSCPELHMQKGPLPLRVEVDRVRVGQHSITADSLSFTLRYPLPPQSVGKKSIEIAIEVDRTLSTPNDDRKMGVIITTVSLVKDPS